jgi:hypothetical protein
MNTTDERWVAKVHPLSRAAEAEDPFELMAEPAPGVPSVMLECILQEFAWMGWSPEQLLALFHHPGYPVLCQLRECFGDEEIRRQVDSLVARWGVLRFRETIAEPEDEPELVQITLPSQVTNEQ